MKIRQKFVKNLTNEFVIRHFPVDEQVFVTILAVRERDEEARAGNPLHALQQPRVRKPRGGVHIGKLNLKLNIYYSEN